MEDMAAPGRVYLWNLLGSGAGAFGIVAALSVLPPMTCLALVAGIGLAAAATGETGRGGYRGLIMIAGVAVIGAAAWAAGRRSGRWPRTPSPNTRKRWRRGARPNP